MVESHDLYTQVIIHSDRLPHYMYEVEAGVVSVFHLIPNPDEPDDTVVKMINEEEMQSWLASSTISEVQDRDLPSSFRF